MSTGPNSAESTGASYVSTGHLPPAERVTALVDEAYERFQSNAEGKNSEVYPALARARRDLFGICVVGTDGNVHAVGDAEVEFSIMSVSKPFVFALVCQQLGVEEVRQKIGVNATGMAFNSLAAIERGPQGRTNPMVNSGAIATTSLTPGANLDAKWKFIHDGLSRFAGERCRSTTKCTNRHRRRISAIRASPVFCRATASSSWTRPRRPTSTLSNAR